MSKRRDSTYRSGRSPDWIKMKNPACEAVLTMRRTGLGLGFGVGKDDPDFVVYSGKWQIGRIDERRGFPDDVRFYWSLHGVGRPAFTPAILEAVKAEFAPSWKR